MTQLDILIVEDDVLQRKALVAQLRKGGHEAIAVESLKEAHKAVGKNKFHLILLDMHLPDGDGLGFLESMRAEGGLNAESDVVVITGHSNVDSAVRAIKVGAYDYLTKPYEDEYLLKIIRNISRQADLDQRVKSLSRLTSKSEDDVWQLDDMIGTDALRDVFDTAQRVADADSTTVLILGETGTGKGMLAKAIHRLSGRREKPFVDINCSAIPGQLLETEVFGHERGAFTDAKDSRPGLMEVANGGTVFLDEIGDMPLALQSKLLKVIEDKAFRRVGGVKMTQVDVRIIAATCQDLKQLVKEGKFRNDLYYRLCVFPLTLPPLREHTNSIEHLARHYLQVAQRETGRKINGFSQNALAAMRAYEWPGNVRELRNAVERAVILAREKDIGESDLGLGLEGAVHKAACVEANLDCAGGAAEAVSGGAGVVGIRPMPLADCEKELIRVTLDASEGNRNRAAEILGIHRTTLYKKISEYGL